MSLSAAVFVVVAMLAGCGSNGAANPKSADQGVTVPSSESPGSSAGSTVTVDVQGGEYFFKSSLTTFKVGVPYHFVVRNVGDIEHEFMVVKPIAAGAMSMEMMDSMAMGHIEDSDLQAHRTATVDVTFTKPYPAGTIEMACHIGKHYEKGMHIPIVVAP